MAEPRYRRMKEARPRQITDAAFAAFAEHGYAATRVDDVARRAGISKGLMYVYFETKEDLFKAVIRSVVVRRVDTLVGIVEQSDMPAADFLRGPLADFMKQIPGSPVAVVLRLLLSEGPRHPDLVEYYWQNVVSKGLAAAERCVERGVERGEFRATAVSDLPQLLLAPMLVATLWKLLFTEHALDTDALIDTHVDMLLAYLEKET